MPKSPKREDRLDLLSLIQSLSLTTSLAEAAAAPLCWVSALWHQRGGGVYGIECKSYARCSLKIYILQALLVIVDEGTQNVTYHKCYRGLPTFLTSLLKILATCEYKSWQFKLWIQNGFWLKYGMIRKIHYLYYWTNSPDFSLYICIGSVCSCLPS